MENKKDAQYDFCPKCGALARDGVCTSCGYQNPQVTAESAAIQTEENSQENSYVYTEQKPQENFYVYSDQNPYAEYVNRTAYENGAIPPDFPQKTGKGKTIAVVGACIVLLLTLLGCVAYQLTVSGKQTALVKETNPFAGKEPIFQVPDKEPDSAKEEPEENLEDYDYENFYKNIMERAKRNEKESDKNHSPESCEDENGYYVLQTTLREDLPYYVTFAEEEYEEEDRNVSIYCSYPVLGGDIPNREYLNQMIYDEYQYFYDYYKDNVEDDLDSDEAYRCFVEGYVAYMDEEKISIVFSENAEWADYYMLTLYCINIDVENGVILDNTAILDVDDAFSVDFRIREEKQNKSNSLDWYTDQELTEMLNDSLDLIVFYTPLGMEIGVNHANGWCTVTYRDYEKYLKRF